MLFALLFHETVLSWIPFLLATNDIIHAPNRWMRVLSSIHDSFPSSQTVRVRHTTDKTGGAEERILWICGGHPAWCSVQLQRTTENTSRAMPIPSMDRGLPEPLQIIAVVWVVIFDAATSQVIHRNYHAFVSRLSWKEKRSQQNVIIVIVTQPNVFILYNRTFQLKLFPSRCLFNPHRHSELVWIEFVRPGVPDFQIHLNVPAGNVAGRIITNTPSL